MRLLIRAAAGLALLLLLIQIVPYGRDHTNPPVAQEVEWDSASTKALVEAACYDCHSNETAWPWYSNIAPISWQIRSDVERGREALNFSDAANPDNEFDDVVEVVQEGEMPPLRYELAHPGARLDDSQVHRLIEGLISSLPIDDDRDRG